MIINVEIIGWIITVGLAVVGWMVAIVLSVKNRKLQLDIEQKKMRHEAYRTFIKEMDAISQEISSMPIKSFQSIIIQCNSAIATIDPNDPNRNALEARYIEEYYKEMWRFLEDLMKPIKHVSRAISALELDATDELKPMLMELKNLIVNIDKDWQVALSANGENEKKMQQIAAIAKSKKWDRYETLYNKIVEQMRKECNLQTPDG